MFPKVKYLIVKPGDRIPPKGVEVLAVTANGKWLGKPPKGAGKPNALCASMTVIPNRPEDAEDSSSIGLVFTRGGFRMLHLADCGPVDVCQVSIHGQDKGLNPVLAQALHARVALMGSSPRKAGAPASWGTFKSARGMEDIWQVYYSDVGGNDPTRLTTSSPNCPARQPTKPIGSS